MDDARASSPTGTPRAGARIANSRGAVGTLGCFARTRDARIPVILSCQHVLFGHGGQSREWWSTTSPLTRAGRVRHGRRGIVRHEGADTYVDCATGEFEPPLGDARLVPESAGAAPSRHDTVHTVDAAGVTTHGTVLATSYSETVLVAGENTPATRQILVGTRTPGRPFSQPGDSGAILRNEQGAAIGLLWGYSASGDALACPIAPVLWVLDIELARLAPGAR